MLLDRDALPLGGGQQIVVRERLAALEMVAAFEPRDVEEQPAPDDPVLRDWQDAAIRLRPHH